MHLSERIVYKNCRVGGKLVDLEITDGIFTAIGRLDREGIDLGGNDVFPGLIDIHTHGANGYSVYGVEDTVIERNVQEVSLYLAKNGITTWYPTTCSLPKALRATLALDLDSFRGANIPGIHLEGPYLSTSKPGAIDPGNMCLPRFDDFDSYDKIKYITVAPEIEGALDYIKEMSGKVKISVGHTCAGYETTVNAIKNGADCLNHTFNAMPPLHHREPGPIGAALDSGIYAEVICDGVHLHPSIVRMLYRAFGKERMIMISDTVSGAGLPDGEFVAGNTRRFIKDGVIRNEAGNLAGSWCHLFEDVRRTVKMGIPREDVYYMAATTPAEYMGLNKGKIEVGYDADFIVVTENDELLKTVIAGEIFTE